MDLISIMKKAAAEAEEERKPVNILYGTVMSTKPLTVSVEQKLQLSEPFLQLTRNVKDYSVEITVSLSTLTAGEPTHSHDVTGRKTITVHNALSTGEKVIMFRMQGGQKYLIVDRA